jgi:hypothetical protein
LWRDAHRENNLQWREIKGLKEQLAVMEGLMKTETQRGEEMAAQMAALSLKERELDARLEETKDFSSRLSRLVLHLIRGFMDQSHTVGNDSTDSSLFFQYAGVL